jgi:hypothetical protein
VTKTAESMPHFQADDLVEINVITNIALSAEETKQAAEYKEPEQTQKNEPVRNLDPP